MKIFIEKLCETDFERLFIFDLENRHFFETMVPSRGDDYYEYDNFKLKNEALLEEQSRGISYFYLIKDESDSILGRINLVDIDPVERVGSVGYRIGEVHTGQGIANHALKMLLEEVSELGVKHIKAMTTTDNVASQKVLEKNRFVLMAAREEDSNLNEENGFIYYSWSEEDSLTKAD
ncbi:GNAT family N-acetyltransferase [Bacillus sp. DTU_2020_1000418_1_SI_GHA_SEK_038]|uniref:GNAT family N-acetyltransferase n=1 Tax=Bacillus sp. DTU_2020_1000418_1_SI_GHA_SEK_038 TaxID=3077585 RepID=UPI0028E4305A|nr:GNAT family N-acetyltransferase [Bacillus sp. DTU_2020_1000418_1_SI_GHA_SEK_038]WNS74981.1 GNAT family N-acetyltransferase [Bacillus sp. DTU_2020_1000418_1_SI_GHA_SEK_038]